jgi:predicted outer membrane repeat protein
MQAPNHPTGNRYQRTARPPAGHGPRGVRGLVVVLALMALPAAHATSVTVTNTSDENDGNTSSIAALGTGGPDGKISLREAVLATNNTAGADTIVLGTHGYSLSSSLGTLTISDTLTIQGNGAGSTSISGGNNIRIFSISGATAVTFSNLTLKNGSAPASSDGGAILNGTGTLTLSSVTLSSNNANSGNGGAISNPGGTLSLTSTNFTNNSCNNNGGAIYSTGPVTDSSSTFNNNTAKTGNGGALALSGGSAMSLTNTTLTNNRSNSANGGAIAYSGSSTLTLNTVTFTNNQAGQGGGDGGTASGYGGAIYNSAGNLSLTSVSASNSQSGLDGGAIDSLFGTLTDTNGSYSSNQSSDGNGGGLALAGSASATLSGTTVTSNSAHTAGGGIAVSGTASLSTSSSASIQSNNANSGGGISFQSSSTLTITDTTLASNTTNGGGDGGGGYGGGGLYMTAGSGTILRSTFASNTASSGGGDGGGSCGHSSTGCGGGAINFQSSSTLTLTNDTISENVSGNYGGGVLVDGGTLNMMNVTVATNQGTTGSGLLQQAGTLTLTNTIVAYNFGGNACSGTITSGGHNLDSANTCAFGSGNLVNTDPYLAPLASNGGLTQTRALYSDSPAKGAGTSTGAPTTDQRSVARASPPCVGAYEFNSTTGTHPSVAGKFNAVDGYFASYPASSSGQKIYTKLTSTSFTLNLAALNNATPTPGLYSPAYVSGANQVRVDLVDDSDGACASSCSSSNCTGKQAVASVTTSFASGDSSYKTGVSFSVSNADANLRVRILDESYAPVYACSVDNFSVRPTSLTISSSANADSTGTSATATPTVKTGTTFTLSADGGWGYNGVPSITTSAITVNPSNAGTLSGSFSSGGGGEDNHGATGNFTYSEVGYFSLNANAVTDLTYTAVDQSSDCTANYSNTLVNGKYGCYVGSTASPYFGRFIPDHFTITAGTVTPACGTFSYFDQDGFVTNFTLTAQNSSSVTTKNYTGSFARMGLTSWAGFVFTGDTATPSASATAPSGTWSNGAASVTAKHQVVVRPTSSPLAPANLTVSAKPVDPDGVTSTSSMPVMSAATSLKFGELALGSASGPATANLSLAVNANYWNGTGWVTNTADACTGPALGNATIALGNFVASSGGTFSTSVTTPSLSSSWSQGAGTIVLAAPNVAGTANVAINLGSGATDASCVGWSVTSTGAVVPWLRGSWCGSTYGQDPSSLATFGTATSTPPFVYLRENH